VIFEELRQPFKRYEILVVSNETNSKNQVPNSKIKNLLKMTLPFSSPLERSGEAKN
jgi:hypothetical protein